MQAALPAKAGSKPHKIKHPLGSRVPLYIMLAPFMILFFGVYALFGCILTLIAFFSRIHTQQVYISFWDGLRAVLLSGFELVGMRFILMLVRMNALLGYRKNRSVWGEKERFRHNRE